MTYDIAVFGRQIPKERKFGNWDLIAKLELLPQDVLEIMGEEFG